MDAIVRSDPKLYGVEIDSSCRMYQTFWVKMLFALLEDAALSNLAMISKFFNMIYIYIHYILIP